jgi:hypothetical protein
VLTDPSSLGLNQLVTRALYSLIVGVFVMIALPVSQLRLATMRVECCCPDPDHCKCPDHGKNTSGQPTMQPCHKTSEAIASGSSAELSIPQIAAIDVPATQVVHVSFVISDPHEPPSPPRPPRPS